MGLDARLPISLRVEVDKSGFLSLASSSLTDAGVSEPKRETALTNKMIEKVNNDEGIDAEKQRRRRQRVFGSLSVDVLCSGSETSSIY